MPGAETFRTSAADAYDRHVGRYGATLAAALIAFARRRAGLPRPRCRAVARARSPPRSPSGWARPTCARPILRAVRSRLRLALPGVEVVVAAAESLPFADGALRRRALAARRQLPHRCRGGRARDGARDPARRRRRRLRLGLRRRDDAPARVLGRRPGDRPRGRCRRRRGDDDELVQRARARRAWADAGVRERAHRPARGARRLHGLRRALVAAPDRRRALRRVLQVARRRAPRRTPGGLSPSPRRRRRARSS